MSYKTWLNFWLIFPLPVLIVLEIISQSPTLLATLFSHSTFLLVVGAEYLVLAIILTIWGYSKEPEAIFQASWIMPILFLPFIVVAYVWITLPDADRTLVNIVSGSFNIIGSWSGLYLLLFIYFYILIMRFAGWLLKLVNLIGD